MELSIHENSSRHIAEDCPLRLSKILADAPPTYTAQTADTKVPVQTPALIFGLVKSLAPVERSLVAQSPPRLGPRVRCVPLRAIDSHCGCAIATTPAAVEMAEMGVGGKRRTVRTRSPRELLHLIKGQGGRTLCLPMGSRGGLEVIAGPCNLIVLYLSP